jgi:hypothetical protein
MASLFTMGVFAQQTVIFDGIPHTALGNAKLSISNGFLTVDNIGQSGNDGVAASLGGAQALVTTMGEIDPLKLPSGAYIYATAYGQFNGKAAQQLGSLTMTIDQPDIVYHCDFSRIGATAARGRLTLRGKTVAVIENLVGPIVRICDPIRCDRIDPVWQDRDRLFAMVQTVDPVPMTVPALDNQTFLADGFEIEVLGVKGRIENIDTMAFTSRLTGSFGIDAQELVQNKFKHIVSGDAQIRVDSDNVIVSGFGNSGNDGVALSLEDGDRFTFDLAPVAIDTLGDAMYFGLYGTVSGDDSLLGEVSFSNDGANLNMLADYNAAGSATVRVDVMRDGRVVGRAVVPSGNIGTIVNAQRLTGIGQYAPFAASTCFWARFEHDATFELVDGTSATGNEVRILANEANPAIDGSTLLDIRVTGINSLMLQREVRDMPSRPLPQWLKN